MPDAPIVTVAIANWNGAAHIGAAVRSALRQTLTEIEVIVVDDVSSDESCALVEAIAKTDKRLRLERLTQNRGPGGARNRALELARGRWFAVLDSDDFFHPDRLERLVALAEADRADAIADDLLLFDEGVGGTARRFLPKGRRRQPSWISAADYIASTRMFDAKVNFGFLKPVFRTDFLRGNGLSYDEAMRIGEDDNLIVRALAAGMRYRLSPRLSYFYRKHPGSISHRIGAGHLDQMIARSPALEQRFGEDRATRAEMARRARSFVDAKAFSEMVDALKAKRLDRAIAAALRNPLAVRHFRMPLRAALGRLMPMAKAKAAPVGQPVVFISRQRVIGRTNGSSAYLLGLAEAVRDHGFTPVLIQPSPHVFGRWPVLPLKPEMDVFGSIALRGAVQSGRWLISAEPFRYVAAARAAAGQVLQKVGIKADWLAGEKAIYAIGAPWEDEDLLFLARHSPQGAAALVGDYAFMAPALPFALSPGAPSALIMHDLFSARAESLGSAGATDGVAVLSEAEEFGLLGQADAVVAIQKTEGETVQKALPRSRVIVAPMAADPVAEPRTGEDDNLLFVGSAAHPNVVGLQWMLDEVWPRIRAQRPNAALTVVGSVSRSFGAPPAGVTFAGVAPDLSPYYERAGVVISPLVAGSGLKIKLIEALAQGKAIVATSVTLQGVEQETRGAVAHADEAEDFAQAVIDLAGDPVSRARLAETALSTAKRFFGREACYADFGSWLENAAGGRTG